MVEVTIFYDSQSILSNMYRSELIDDAGELFTCFEQYYIYHQSLFHGYIREAETVKQLYDRIKL